MKEELLIESWGHAGVADGDSGLMVESYDDKETGNLYIEGVFLQAEVVNGNGRIYPKKVMEKAVAKYIHEQVNRKQSLGEMNHPGDRSYPDPMKSALIIESLEWRGNNVWGRARIIEGDNAEGDKAAALIRAGWIPGVSSRGLGALKRNSKGLNEVQEGYRLTVGVDMVWGPSAPDAYTKAYRMKESKDDLSTPINNTDDGNFKTLISALKNTI